LTKGIVKFFYSNKGYGFITSEDDLDIFIHFTDIIDEENYYKSLSKGDKVEFDIIQEEKGPKAINIRIIERSSVVEYYKETGYSRRSFPTPKKEKLTEVDGKKETSFRSFDF